MYKLTILVFALATYASATLPIPYNPCGPQQCKPVVQCYVPSCGLENYCNNRDFFNFKFGKILKKIKLKNLSIRNKFKNMKKKRRALLADLRLKRRQIQKEQREVRKNIRQKRKQLNQALRQRLKEMRRQRREFRKAFRNRRKCGFGCFPIEDSGDNSGTGGSDDNDGSDSDGDDNDGDDSDGSDSDGSDNDGSDSDGGDESDASDEKDDDEINYIINSKNPLKNLIKKCGQDVSALSQFLRNKKNKKLKKFLLNNYSQDCDDECENKALDVFGIWVNLIKQFKGICIKRRYSQISNCGLRKQKMLRVFNNLCSGYSSSLKKALLDHYHYLIGGLGCGALVW